MSPSSIRTLHVSQDVEIYLKEQDMKREYVFVLLFLLDGPLNSIQLRKKLDWRLGRTISPQLFEKWYKDLYERKYIKKHPSKTSDGAKIFTLFPKGVDFIKELDYKITKINESR